ncbi:MAG: TIGR01777 family oxidoreductase [Planctomycetota bacterium]
MRALVTGATGFIGKGLVDELKEPVVLSRSPERARALLGDLEIYPWDAALGPPPQEALRDVEVVFHLAGEPLVGRRWNPELKQRLKSSRVLGTQHLVDSLRELTHKPRVLVSASAIGFYGTRGADLLDESAKPGDDFLSGICVEWEGAAQEAVGLRTVQARIGIVLGSDGGALPQMLTPFKLGVGGCLGSGRQWMSWIHHRDLVALLLHMARNDSLSGPVNAVAPTPVTNREFTRTLAAALHRPALVPVPKLALRLALGEVAEFILASLRVVPNRALDTGFEFQYPQLGEALEEILA